MATYEPYVSNGGVLPSSESGLWNLPSGHVVTKAQAESYIAENGGAGVVAAQLSATGVPLGILSFGDVSPYGGLDNGTYGTAQPTAPFNPDSVTNFTNGSVDQGWLGIAPNPADALPTSGDSGEIKPEPFSGSTSEGGSAADPYSPNTGETGLLTNPYSGYTGTSGSIDGVYSTAGGNNYEAPATAFVAPGPAADPATVGSASTVNFSAPINTLNDASSYLPQSASMFDGDPSSYFGSAPSASGQNYLADGPMSFDQQNYLSGISDQNFIPGASEISADNPYAAQAPGYTQAANPIGDMSLQTEDWDSIQQGVGQNDLVQNQLNSMLQSGSPYLDRARTSSQQASNARGLLNSSMAAGAGEAAAIDAALPIAQQDASTNFQQGLANQQYQNQAASQNAQIQNQASMLLQQGQINEALQLLQGNQSMDQMGYAGDIASGQSQLNASLEGVLSNQNALQQQGLTNQQGLINQGLASQGADIGLTNQYQAGLINQGMNQQGQDYNLQSTQYQGEVNAGLQTLGSDLTNAENLNSAGINAGLMMLENNISTDAMFNEAYITAGLNGQEFEQASLLASQEYSNAASLLQQEVAGQGALATLAADNAITLEELRQFGESNNLSQNMFQQYTSVQANIMTQVTNEISQVNQAEGLTADQKLSAIQTIYDRRDTNVAFMNDLFSLSHNWTWGFGIGDSDDTLTSNPGN